MTPEEFGACFDRFTRTVFRLENLPEYRIGGAEEERIQAFLRGEPRPERSVRSSPWLARIASTTIAGKEWSRVHVVDEPLGAYLRYELAGYVESQAIGEEIRIARRSADPALKDLPGDFWLFDGGTADAYAIAMDYDAEGNHQGDTLVTNSEVLERDEKARQMTWDTAEPLNVYLSGASARSR